MKKPLYLYIFMVVVLTMPGFAFAETLTMTTYYPSPFGVYQSIRLAPNASPPACSGATVGTMYVDASFDLQYCNGSGYTKSLGQWRKNGTSLYPFDVSTANVGLGTNTPQTRLHVQSAATDYTAIRIHNTDGDDAIWEMRSHQADPSDGFSIWGGESGSEAVRMAITEAGDVGIGNTNPSEMLEVSGNIKVNDTLVVDGAIPKISSPNSDLVVEMGAGLNFYPSLNTGGLFYVYDADTTSHLFTIVQNTQRVGILNAAPATELDVNGTVTAVAYLYSSDARQKENFKPVTGLDGILALNGLSYTRKLDGEPDIGVTAQDVEAVYPELVHTDETTGKKYVKYGNLVAPMIEAIKDQQELIDLQSEQIRALQKELDIIKTKIND